HPIVEIAMRVVLGSGLHHAVVVVDNRSLDVIALEGTADEGPKRLWDRSAIHFLVGRDSPQEAIRVRETEFAAKLEFWPRLRLDEFSLENVAEFTEIFNC